ncbi:MAG: heavy-metal-associated domain-containing protein [Flavobacterium sp.]|jgi:copper chaperone CopZ|nr:heavy-metal-associated domain-containing protein [Flavobacterium sp.]
MKKIIALLFFVALFFNANAQILKAELIANGLTCSMCTNATYNQLKTIPFLDSIDTDVEHTKFILYFKKNTPFDLKMIKSKVEDAGFSVGSLVLFMKFDNVSVENDFHYTIGDITYHFMDTKKQTLNNITQVKLIDKGFISDKEYKKYLKLASKYPCYKAGKMENIKVLYHLKII